MSRPGVVVLALLVAGVGTSTATTTTPSRAPVLRVRGGSISGKVLTSAAGRQYFAYLGVPYAAPPLGDLRFKFPRRLEDEAWKGVRRCDTDPPKCPQLSYPERRYEGDEDCLYLNVYTHKTEDLEQPMEAIVNNLRPVLVWLHGGNFQHGSGTFDDVGPERFMDNDDDIVLVVPNFRLNALGFLSIGRHPAVGNAGMKDVFSALSWLHGNVAQFGGHPGRITLGGFQAGGAAAHLQALSPLSSSEPNLFGQTVSMSGSALSPWAVLPTAEATRRAVKLGRALGCVAKSVPDGEVKTPEMVRCLRVKPAEDIVKACEGVLDWYGDLSFPFVPSVEEFDGHNRPFMITPPAEVLRDHLTSMRHSKSWMTGGTTHDGLPHALQTMVFRGQLRELNERFDDSIWKYLGLSHIADEAAPEALQSASKRLRDFYLPGNQTIALGTLSGLIDLTSDALYLHSMYKAVQYHSAARKAPTFVYQFGFDRHKDRTRVLGVPLGADTQLIFPSVFANEKSNLTTEEEVLSKKLLRLLTNFVSSGDPTPNKEDLLNDAEWPNAEGNRFSFLDIGIKGRLSVKNWGFYFNRMSLWDSVFQQLNDVSFQGEVQRLLSKEEL